MHEKLIVTGNPVRPVFYTADPVAGRNFLGLSARADFDTSDREELRKPVLLVLGGSSGARQINDLVRDNLDWLCERFIVIHQTGAATICDGSVQTTSEISESYKSYPFIYADMPHVMAAADVVLSRAGSNFLWECAVTGKALILVPLEGAGTRGDQIENAAFFEASAAAIVLNSNTADSVNLKIALTKMLDANVRKRFSVKAAQLATTQEKDGIHPATRIAGILYYEELGKL
jgi:UDP-N-acetylglucosamine--N-acetylmuramyl-(pentapeptide) pyrophosphoryl-undecaprenol N-acetylglucosamine transferase